MNHVTASGWFPALPVVGNESFHANFVTLGVPWRSVNFSAVSIRL